MSAWIWCALAPVICGAEPDPPLSAVMTPRSGVHIPAPVIGFAATSTLPPPLSPAGTAAVVCPPSLLPALAPWIAYRQDQGYHLVHVDATKNVAQIVASIRRVAARHGLQYVVLVGDADPQLVKDLGTRARSVPTFFAPAKMTVQWGSEELIATDNPYGDLDGDHVPDVAVGRLSADTPEELRRIVGKIMRYESLPRHGLWRRKIELVAGVGGFGPLADSVLETAARRVITSGIPASFQTALTYASWRSPFCPDPRAFRTHLLRRVEEGCLLWVYLGHGRTTRLDRIQFDDLLVPILEPEDVPDFGSPTGPPIAVLLACYTGAYDAGTDCLAERLLSHRNGPVAVISGSRMTMPYAMTILGAGLMDGYFEKQLSTLGAIFLHAKQILASNHEGGVINRKLLDSVAKVISPTRGSLEDERREHQYLFQLLGDPMLRLAHPTALDVSCPHRVTAGEKLRVEGNSSVTGRCLVELVCRRDRLTFDPPRRAKLDDSHAGLAAMDHVYFRANDDRWASRAVDLEAGPFVVELSVPSDARGPSSVRVFVDGTDDYAAGAADVYISRIKATAARGASHAKRATR